MPEENVGITEWFGLEGTLKIAWVQYPCHGQGLELCILYNR